MKRVINKKAAKEDQRHGKSTRTIYWRTTIDELNNEDLLMQKYHILKK